MIKHCGICKFFKTQLCKYYEFTSVSPPFWAPLKSQLVGIGDGRTCGAFVVSDIEWLDKNPDELMCFVLIRYPHGIRCSVCGTAFVDPILEQIFGFIFDDLDGTMTCSHCGSCVNSAWEIIPENVVI